MTVIQPSLRIDFSEAPYDPIARLAWLSGAKETFDTQLDSMWRATYFDARLSGRFQSALDLRFHSRKRALAFTRSENERRGRPLRWGDGF